MDINVFYGILIPFLGTSAGAACVFFMKKNLNEQIQRALTGFAAGVMVAASIWSLLLPAIEQSSGLGKLSFVPAAVGFWIGVLFLLLLDHMIPHLHQNSDKAEGPKSRLQRTTMLVLAVTLHNIPEGMAVGVVYAGYLTGHAQITIMGAMALSIGIAIQNFPPAFGRNGKDQSLCRRSPVRDCRTCRCSPHNPGCRPHCPGTSISFKLRCRSYALCSSGRTHTRNVCRRTLQHWNYFLRCRILSNDDSGCSSWIKKQLSDLSPGSCLGVERYLGNSGNL